MRFLFPELPPHCFEYIFCPLGFAYGATVGSFLNVCIHRLPHERSITSPPSHCPWCRTQLRAIDLVPLLSQLLLRARCRYCGQRIAWRYFGVELLTAISFAGVVAVSRDPLIALQGTILVACLIATFFIDLDHFIIPDEVNWMLALSGLAPNLLALLLGANAAAAYTLIPLNPLAEAPAQLLLPNALLGAAVSGGALLLVREFGQLVFRKEAMGWGDVKLAAAVGANLMAIGTLWDVLTFYLLSFLIGATISVGLIALRWRRRSDYIPFGPMLAMGAYLTWFLGPNLVTPITRSLYNPFAMR